MQRAATSAQQQAIESALVAQRKLGLFGADPVVAPFRISFGIPIYTIDHDAVAQEGPLDQAHPAGTRFLADNGEALVAINLDEDGGVRSTLSGPTALATIAAVNEADPSEGARLRILEISGSRAVLLWVGDTDPLLVPIIETDDSGLARLAPYLIDNRKQGGTG